MVSIWKENSRRNYEHEGGIIIVSVDFDDNSYTYLIQLLNEKYYNTTDISELQRINNLYKLLRYKSESWLSAIQPQKSNKNKK